jgi:predicted P-loop ATPase
MKKTAESQLVTSNDDEKEYNAKAIERLETYLNNNYEFRFNTIKQQTEWKSKIRKSEFKEISDYILNSITRKVKHKGLKGSAAEIAQLLQSDFVPMINPIKEYFDKLPIIKGFENIEALIDCLKIVNHGLPHRTFITKWLVAVVANAMIDNGCQNQTCLVLIGEQGTFKTTFLTSLCPKKLDEYIYTGRLELDKKDTQFQLSRYLFMNIDDQFKRLARKDSETVKTLITLPEIKQRRSYGKFDSSLPRVASFMGSVNGNEFLTDPTGNRRFISLEVDEIDIDRANKIDKDKVWSEAYYAFKDGFQYWIDSNEVEMLNESNNAFTVSSPEHDVLITNFEPCTKTEGQSLTITQLVARLEELGSVKLMSSKLSEVLKKQGFLKWQKGTGKGRVWVYSVKIRQSEL